MTASVASPHRPFYELLGLRVDPREDAAVVRLPHRPDLANSRGHVHGGATTTLLDAALARAVRLHDRATESAVTVDITVHFLGPGSGELTCTGRVVSFGRTIAVAEAEAVDQQGNRVARATGTFRLFARRGTKQSTQEEATDAAHR